MDRSRRFQEVKKRLQTIVPVTPVDTSKPLMIYADASNSGIGWILTQRKDNKLDLDENWKENQIVIEMGSTSLSECQSRYSPVEKETLAAVTAVTKLDFFLGLLRRYTFSLIAPLWLT